MRRKILLIAFSLMIILAFLLSSASFGLDACNVIGKAPKYVFLFIGDGMGLSHTYSAELYLNSKNNVPVLSDRKRLCFTQFPVTGLATNYCINSTVTDSAAAGTAISTGQKTAFGVICMDETKTKNLTTMAEVAKKYGRKVGIISSCSLDNATPACFYAHESGRGSAYKIAMQMIDSKFDYFAGGGISCGEQTDIYQVLHDNGLTLVSTRDEFLKLKKIEQQKIYAFDPNYEDGAALYYNIDKKGNISLAEFTKKGIELLDNKKGFFMMVEGGKIDYACHSNDAASAIKELIAFDDAVKVAFDFYSKHKKDTLIVVTADHETGGFATGYSETRFSTYLERLDNQTMSFIEFNKIIKAYKASVDIEEAKLDDLADEIQSAFGLKLTSDTTTDPMLINDYEYCKLYNAFRKSIKGENVYPTTQEDYVVFGGIEPITITLLHILNNKAGIGWTTYMHSASPIPIFAIGVNSESFGGYIDNTDIGKRFIKMLQKK